MMMKRWKYVIPTSLEKIQKVEAQLQYQFPVDFQECVLENNAGTPDEYLFFLPNHEEKVFGGLLSFNEEDQDFILRFNQTPEKSPIITVGQDAFGNRIGFLKKTNEIVYQEHETEKITRICSTWTDFCHQLKK